VITAFHPWHEDAGTLHNDAWPLQLAFHSFDPFLAITDDADHVW
jgi:regulator-associated protein of mTOR